MQIESYAVFRDSAASVRFGSPSIKYTSLFTPHLCIVISSIRRLYAKETIPHRSTYRLQKSKEICIRKNIEQDQIFVSWSNIKTYCNAAMTILIKYEDISTWSLSFCCLYRLSLMDDHRSSTRFLSTMKSSTYSYLKTLCLAIQSASPTGNCLVCKETRIERS